MKFDIVATIGGYKSHRSLDGNKTLCGQAVSNSTRDWDPCKRCIKIGDKLSADRERTEYNARVAEMRDDVMSQAAPVDAPAVVEPERVPMSIMVTTTDGEMIEYAEIPNGDPERVQHFADMAKRGGAFRTVIAVPTPVIHYGESRPLCGAKLGEYDGCTTSISQATCVPCWDEAVRPVDVAPPAPEYKIEITRHRVSYYAPDNHSQCEHSFNQDENGECDSVGGRWLDGERRELSEVETETITWDPEYDPETYEGTGPEARSQWVKDKIDSLGYFEPSCLPIGESIREHAWLSTNDRDSVHTPEETTEISVRLTGSWTDEDRAFAFSYVTGCK